MMKFLPHALAVLMSGLLLPSAFAERFGSETPVTIQGTYYTAGETSSQTFDGGDTRVTATAAVTRVTNRTILETMRDRALIPRIAGYQLVMVARAHMADGVAWFATPANGTPVPVPADLLSLEVSNGPATGQLVVDDNAVLKSLKQQTYNHATLVLAGNFIGTGVLTQTWKSRAVKNGSVTEVVEYVNSDGLFNGILDSDSEAGVGVVQFTLTAPKIVDLTRYGMASVITDSVSGGSLSLGGTVTNIGGTLVTAGTLSLGTGNLSVGGTLSLGNLTAYSFGGILTINTTSGGTVTGLVVDEAGNITALPVFTGSFMPSSVIIITATGTHTFLVNGEGVLTAATDV